MGQLLVLIMLKDPENFTEVDSNKQLMSYLINHFCCPGGTVLEYTKTGGKVP